MQNKQAYNWEEKLNYYGYKLVSLNWPQIERYMLTVV